MAEKKKAKAAKPKKAKMATSAKGATRKPAKKAAPKKPGRASTKPKAAPRSEASPASSGFDITRLIDHPLVADLLAVGAMAAVAAIAEHQVKTRTGEVEPGSSKVVKAAGRAVAAALGRRLMTEVNEAKKSSDSEKAKRGSA